MRVQLLGTGAADGWPQPFCVCASCTYARTHAIVRGRSGVLIDGQVLLDPSPDAASSASRAGTDLAQVSAVLVGHGHPDHLDPSLLLARQWAEPDGPLEVHGPRSAIELVRPWLNPDALDSGLVRLREAVIGADVVLPSGHRARALPAEHGLGEHGRPRVDPRGPEPDAVLWEVTSGAGVRLLHAADTGPMPDTTISMVARLDLLLVEETFGDVLEHETAHLDLAALPEVLARLRRYGAIDAGTQIVAVHLAHHNPPEPELQRRLALWGARAGRDGEVIDLAPTVSALPPPAPDRILITGGARSGKSREAERLVSAHARVHYVATSAPRERDPEWDERIERHRTRRPAEWTTHETADAAHVIAAAGVDDAVLVDCLTLWVTRIIDDAQAWDDACTARAVVSAACDALTRELSRARCRVVLVTNEVGSGIVPERASVRMFRDLVGEVNSRVAAACDRTVMAVAGGLVDVAGHP